MLNVYWNSRIKLGSKYTPIGAYPAFEIQQNNLIYSKILYFRQFKKY